MRPQQHRSDKPKISVPGGVGPKTGRPSDLIVNTEQAMMDYQKDKFSNSSWATRKAWEKTWLEYHNKAITKTPSLAQAPVFPVLPETLAMIAALMKLDGFRSFGNYLSWAKAEHIRQGHCWSQQLEQEAKQAGRSVNRGIGPARQSASFTLEQVAGLPPAAPMRVKGRPVFEDDFVILGSLWIMREIEVAWATRSDITIDATTNTVSWLLPVSKTDAKAKACTRSWGCLCRILGQNLCPFHRWVDYLEKIDAFFNVDTIDKELPIFCDYLGQVIKKKEAVTAIENTMRRLGAAVEDSVGRRLYGGHSMRVSGARFWASRGLEVFKIQIFARWGSQIILRYVSDSPISNVTGDLLSGSSSTVESVSATLPVVSLLERHIVDAREQLEALKAEIARLDTTISPSFVKNAETMTWHKVLSGGLTSPPARWRSRCGWPFGFAAHDRSTVHPPEGARVCKTCFRGIPSRAATLSPSDVDSGSSD